MADYLPLAPEIFLCCAALVILVIDLFIADKHKMILGWLSIAALAVTMVIINVIDVPDPNLFNGMFVADAMSIFFREMFLIAAGLSILISLTYMKKATIYKGEYFVITLFATLGMMFLSASADLVAIFISLELTAISFYILAAFQKNRAESNEAGVKYFILGAVSSSIMVFGMTYLFGLTGTTQISEFSSFAATSDSNLAILAVGLLFLLVGAGFKVAAVPFHMWAPDVYQGAPTPITAYLSVGSKAAGFAMFLRLFVWALASIKIALILPLAVLAAVTMFAGNLGAIPQRNLKRFLAYSSIAQAGYVIMALAMMTELGTQSVLFYLLAYVFSNIGAFAVIIAVSRKNGDTSFKAIAGLGKRSPLLGLALTIFILSLAGIPMLAGFISKFYVFAAVIEEGYFWLAVVGMINSTIALYYYLNILREVYITEPANQEAIEISASLYAGIQICLIGVLVIGLWPAPFLALAENAAKAFF